jgi:hypothetical protein
MGTASQLLGLARNLAATDAEFHVALGAGAGDHRTNKFMRELRKLAAVEFGEDFSERKICGDTAQAVDFYFPSEATIVEVALGLPNPQTEFEKDVLKDLSLGTSHRWIGSGGRISLPATFFRLSLAA